MPRKSEPKSTVKTVSYRTLSDPGSSAFRLSDYPFYLLYRTANVYSELLDRKLKPLGMDKPRWRVLMTLAEHNSAALGLIAEMAVMKLPTIHKIVQRMEEDGLVTTSPRPSDNRVTEVSMSAKGRRMLVEIRRHASDCFAIGTRSLSDEQLMGLNILLRQIESDLEETYNDKDPTLVPPQTNKDWPVTKPAASSRKKRTTRATSSG